MLDFDYTAARNAGYSDDDILDGLQRKGQLGFDLGAARKAGYSASEIISTLMPPPAPAPEKSSLLRRAGDIGISALKGAIAVPETVVGLADIVSGGAAGRAAESVGFRPREAKEILNELYSPEQQAANRRVAEAKGFLPTVGAMVANPSTIVQTGVESLPSMGLGGVAGRGVLAGAARLGSKLGAVGAAAAGEGIVGAGQAAEQIRQQQPGGDLSLGQAGSAIASGIGTGIFGAVGGRIANKLGIGDIDTALVQSGAVVNSTKGIARRMIEGGISEGVFEELPQSIQEQMWQNVAMGKPVLEGVPENAAQGLIAGGLFGGVAGGALHGHAPVKPAQEAAPGETPLLPYKPDPFISFPDGSVGRQSDVDAFLAAMPEDKRNAARARLYGLEAQPVNPDDILQAQSVDQAIAISERAIAEGTPEFRAQRDADIDAAWNQYLAQRAGVRLQEFEAAKAQRAATEEQAMQAQLQDQAVERANILTEAQGFGHAEPTAMQLAMQRAQEQRKAAAPEPVATAPAQAAQPVSADDLARARSILTAAGVTGNERMSALRSIRAGENTLEDLADAHPPKAINVANQPQNAPSLPQQRVAGAQVPEQLQQPAAPARAPGAPAAAEPGGERAAGAAVPVPDVAAGAGQAEAGPAAALNRLVGRRIDSEWNQFGPRSGTLGVPREAMPQIKAEHRGALTQYLAARGITHEPAREIPAANLKPTQQEFSEDKVRQAEGYQGGDRSILVSSDGYVLDGHHQWLAKLAADEPVKAIQLNAPIAQLLEAAHDFPSSTTAAGAATTQGERNAPEEIRQQGRVQGERSEGSQRRQAGEAGRGDRVQHAAPGAEEAGRPAHAQEEVAPSVRPGREAEMERLRAAREERLAAQRAKPKTEAELKTEQKHARQEAEIARAKEAAETRRAAREGGEEPLKSQRPDYGDEHRPPGRDDGAPLSDLTGDGMIYPDDVYSKNGPRYYGTGYASDANAFRLANMARGNPDFDVMVYRAVPKDVDAKINPGDWVAITRQYAEDHGESRFDGDYKIISKMVKAGDIFTNGDSIQEWGYDPEGAPTESRAAARGGMTIADVTKATAQLRAKWMGFNRVNIVQSVADLPGDLAQRAKADQNTEALFDPRTNAVYLIADNLASPERASFVAAHEVIGHGGLTMLRDKSVTEALKFASGNRLVKELAVAIQDDRDGIAAHVAVEEAIAELSAALETGDYAGLEQRYGITIPDTAKSGLKATIARLFDAIKRFIASVTKQPVDRVSDAEVRDLLSQQQAAVEGRLTSQREPMGDMVRASQPSATERTIEFNGERRPITNSEGDLIAEDMNQQLNFYRWFRDSEVVDSSGHPKVMYHGTSGRISSFVGNKYRGGTTSFTNDIYTARDYAEGAVFVKEEHARKTGIPTDAKITIEKVYLSVQKLFDGSIASHRDQVIAELGKSGAKAPDYYGTWDATLKAQSDDVMETDEVIDAMKSAGFDGQWVSDSGTGQLAINVFSPSQVKSVENTGAFSTQDTDIRASRAPAAPSPAGDEVTPKWAENLTPEQKAALRKSGAIYSEKTMKQKVAELKEGALKKLQYGILDQFAPIKDQLGKIPYVLARMAKNADGTLEALMLYGRPHLDADGGMLVDTTKKGFVETMQQLQGEHDRFFSWLAGRRAEQLKREGRENLFTDEDISALSTLNQGKMKDGSSREAAYLKAQKDVAELNKSVLDIAEKSGLIDGESRKVWQSDFYVPFYRVMEEGVTGPSIKSGLVNQKSIKKLKGGKNNLGDLTQNMLMNWSTLLTASAKNRAAKASLDAATAIGAATEANEATVRDMAKSAKTKAVSYMENGVNRWYVVEDEHLLAAISALEFNGYNNQAMKVMSAFKNYLTMAVTSLPGFKVRNLIRDSLSTIAISKADYNPLANLRNGYSLLRDKETKAQMIAGGGIYRFGSFMEGNRGEHVKNLIDEGVPAETILDTKAKMQQFIGKLWRGYQEAGDLSENLNRAALYEKLRKEGKSHLEASFEARDLMDFGLSGAWAGVRALNQVLPFFNARLQGLYKLGRGYNDDPRRIGAVVGATALASIALMLAYKDDDDFKKRSDSDRNNYWWFKVGDTAYRIPKPFEIGAAASAIEHFTALMLDPENTDAKRFANQMGDLVNGQLAMNPIPQVFRPMIDIYANKDAFTGRPIESAAMQKLRPEDRYTYNTSELARLLSKSGAFVDPISLVSGTGVKQLSPVQIDALIKGYFSGAGTLATAAVDGLLHHSVIDRGEALPATLKDFAGSFAETLPTNSSRYVDLLYSTAQDIEQSYSSYRNALKNGDIAEARAIMEKEGDKIAKYHLVESLKKNESRITQQIQRTMNSKDLTGEQKEEAIRRLKRQQDLIARQFATRA